VLAVFGKMDYDLIGCLADFFREGVGGFLVLHGRSPFGGWILGVTIVDYCLLKKLPWQQKQKFAADCFKLYCEKYNIQHKDIDELLTHLYSMEEYRNEYLDLATWDSIGKNLVLLGVGMGDVLPMDVQVKIPSDKIKEFINILQCTVEVGQSDMWGAQTDLPYEFLIKCIKILEVNSIVFPCIEQYKTASHYDNGSLRSP